MREVWHATLSMLRTHSSGLTSQPQCCLVLSAQCMWTDREFCVRRRRHQLIWKYLTSPYKISYLCNLASKVCAPFHVGLQLMLFTFFTSALVQVKCSQYPLVGTGISPRACLRHSIVWKFVLYGADTQILSKHNAYSDTKTLSGRVRQNSLNYFTSERRCQLAPLLHCQWVSCAEGQFKSRKNWIFSTTAVTTWSLTYVTLRQQILLQYVLLGVTYMFWAEAHILSIYF